MIDRKSPSDQVSAVHLFHECLYYIFEHKKDVPIIFRLLYRELREPWRWCVLNIRDGILPTKCKIYIFSHFPIVLVI